MIFRNLIIPFQIMSIFVHNVFILYFLKAARRSLILAVNA